MGDAQPDGVVTVAGERLGHLQPGGAADHHPANCSPGPCPLHYPSGHALSGWPSMMGDEVYLFVRMCPHGQPHPDPDDPRWDAWDDYHVPHECDGCCPPELR